MNIHEYQAKAILRNFGVPVPEGHVVYNSNSARDWAKRLGEGPWAVKAQIHAGGRGKGGGVKIAKTADEVKQYARDMFGMTLVTHQTGPEGKVVKRVLIETDRPLAAIAQDCGFSSASHFTRYFSKEAGMTPSAYRQQEQRASRAGVRNT